MRRPLLALVLALLPIAPARAEEGRIPIEVASLPQIQVTDAQLDWIRTWLEDHLHPLDVKTLEVDVANRTHPTLLVYAEARLPAKDVDTHRLQRVIRIAHESWDTYGDGYGLEGAQKTGPWRVIDTYVVERIFPLGKASKVLPLVDDLSYAEVHALLKAIHDKAVRMAPEASGNTPPKLEEITWISSEDGQYNVMTTDPEDGLQGSFSKGVMKDGQFVVQSFGWWIS